MLSDKGKDLLPLSPDRLMAVPILSVQDSRGSSFTIQCFQQQEPTINDDLGPNIDLDQDILRKKCVQSESPKLKSFEQENLEDNCLELNGFSEYKCTEQENFADCKGTEHDYSGDKVLEAENSECFVKKITIAADADRFVINCPAENIAETTVEDNNHESQVNVVSNSHILSIAIAGETINNLVRSKSNNNIFTIYVPDCVKLTPKLGTGSFEHQPETWADLITSKHPQDKSEFEKEQTLAILGDRRLSLNHRGLARMFESLSMSNFSGLGLQDEAVLRQLVNVFFQLIDITIRLLEASLDIAEVILDKTETLKISENIARLQVYVRTKVVPELALDHSIKNLLHLLFHLLDITIWLVDISLQITSIVMDQVDPVLVQASQAWRLVDLTFSPKDSANGKISGRIVKVALALKVIATCLTITSMTLNKARSMFCEENSNTAAFFAFAETMCTLGEPLFKMAETVLRLLVVDSTDESTIGSFINNSVFSLSMLRTATLILQKIEAVAQLTDPSIKMTDPVFIQMVAASINAVEQLMTFIEPLVRQAEPLAQILQPLLQSVMDNPAVQFLASPLVKMAEPLVGMAEPWVAAASKGMWMAETIESSTGFLNKTIRGFF